MSWERRVLEHIIVSLVEHDKEFGDLARSLENLGIELNMDGIAYQILTDLTDWSFLPENMEAVHKGALT